MLDGVDAGTLDDIVHAAREVPPVQDVTDARARWVGHRLHVEVSITVPATMTVAEGHAVAKEIVSGVTVHVDPSGEGGDQHHRIAAHAHDGLPVHSHD
jgi:divalent metal cation (Fe/Co/Zn/Cd) transporter